VSSYIYDFEGPLSAREMVVSYAQCSFASPTEDGRYFKKLGGVFWLQQLLEHPWRVLDPANASFIVPPVAISIDKRCETSQRSDELLERVRAGELWQTRIHDHIFVAMSSGQMPSTVPGYPDTLWAGYSAGRRGMLAQPWAPALIAPFSDVVGPITHPGTLKDLDFVFGGQTHAHMYQQGYFPRMAMREQMPALFPYTKGRLPPPTPLQAGRWPSLVYVDSSARVRAEHCLSAGDPSTNWSQVPFEACQDIHNCNRCLRLPAAHVDLLPVYFADGTRRKAAWPRIC